MAEELITKFESQLPKLEKYSFRDYFNYAAGTASIVGSILPAFFIKDQEISQIFYAILLVTIILILVVRDILASRKKLNRYAQAVFFTHYVNHIIRDSLLEISQCRSDNFEDTAQKTTRHIVNAISTCFSIITAKRCRVCIAELKDDFSLLVIARDDVSQITSSKIINKQDRTLDNNTDFSNLWYGVEGCSRYYLSNNLIKDWKKGKYKNSSFDDVGKPEIIHLVHEISFVRNWRLNYKSAIIFPIRYISEFNPPAGLNNNLIGWSYYGFLCIDCNAKNSFDDVFLPELGGTFADAIYSYLSQIEFMEDSLTRP